MADTKKCAHPSCNCMIPHKDKYCSDYCKKAADILEIRCNCGHSDCEKV